MPHLAISGQVAQKKKIEQYIVNLCRALNINRMHSKLIFLNFKTDLGDRYGDCWGDSKVGYVDINIGRKLEGEKIPFSDMMQTLAHEMVHAKQYFRKELNGYATTWKGRNAGGYKYENQPWEREAHRLEAKLYAECWPD
mgnify:FL=1